MTERDFEQEAKSEGWRPQEEWKGDPEKWVTAETFVERGEKISGILKSKVDRLEQRLSKAEKANQKFGEYHKQTIEKERKSHEVKIKQLQSMLAEAVDNGDGQTFNRINQEIDSLKTNMPAPPDNIDLGQLDPITEQWVADNGWYGRDQSLTMFADGAADNLRSQGYSGQAYFNELTRLVRETFPDKFGNPKRDKASGVGEGTPEEEDSPKEKSFKNLPADAKKACKDFVNQGFMTQDEYVEQYFSEEE